MKHNSTNKSPKNLGIKRPGIVDTRADVVESLGGDWSLVLVEEKFITELDNRLE